MPGDGDPLITLLLSCYNQERFVAEALDGVLGQSYRPLDIVVLDDCSTDATADVIARRLAEHPERTDVRFVRQPRNLGTRGNMMSGMALARGVFIVIGCGDDIFYPEFVSEVARVWREENVSMVVTNADYIDDESRPLGRTHLDPRVRADDSFEAVVRDGVNACSFGPVLSFERELFDTFGWPEELDVFDLAAPFFAYLLKGARYVETPLFKYRVHGGNTSLSLQAEVAGEIERLSLDERMCYHSLAQAVFARDTMARLGREQPERYWEIAERMAPLFDLRLSEASRRFFHARSALDRAKRGRPA